MGLICEMKVVVYSELLIDVVVICKVLWFSLMKVVVVVSSEMDRSVIG